MIEMLNSSVFWFSSLPSPNGMLTAVNPRDIVLRQRLAPADFPSQLLFSPVLEDRERTAHPRKEHFLRPRRADAHVHSLAYSEPRPCCCIKKVRM